MEFTYTPKGVCSRSITIKLTDENIIEDVSFYGGCNGNLKGISSLVKGMEIHDVIDKLEGITCGFKQTSCPAQLAEALKQIISQKGE